MDYVKHTANVKWEQMQTDLLYHTDMDKRQYTLMDFTFSIKNNRSGKTDRR